MRGRNEVFGWAALYGLGGGLAVIGAQEAALAGHRGWQVLFTGYAAVTLPVFFALQWRYLMWWGER